jgi:hypothetical protein
VVEFPIISLIWNFKVIRRASGYRCKARHSIVLARGSAADKTIVAALALLNPEKDEDEEWEEI